MPVDPYTGEVPYPDSTTMCNHSRSAHARKQNSATSDPDIFHTFNLLALTSFIPITN
jgi:hypothetical protein